ncbi:protein phosphatase 2C domain-containing protein [Cellulomonas sp. URHE0023]|uniref:protein phosphatase 2C domain-containing protein n=1 Tax=Cellulomonas sp. URHE0023 TaxID=1380354 RepID=UPI000A90F228|nr:protein phosphatase 2C domain-containing protein [Cellulomonas sp. URHE0023]
MDHVVSVACGSCGTVAQDGSKFCEQCGAPLTAPVAVAVPPPAPSTRSCRACGGTIAADGYCQDCGTPAATERDHWSEAPSASLGGVCDRGIRHEKNEDAMALGLAGDAPVLVVCDGVSSVPDSDIASLAAARAARDVLVQGISVPSGDTTRVAAWSALLVRAADAANNAIATAVGDLAERHDPPSCTFVAAVVDGPNVVAGWLGDSRVYWLPDAGDPIQLSSDDSGANELMALGLSRAKAEASAQAHAITRWLGADAPDIVPRTAPTVAQGPGWVLVCSDGLWNYCSEASAVAELVRTSQEVAGPAPEKIAAELVRWANEQGGADNITAALHRIEVVHGTATVDTVHS